VDPERLKTQAREHLKDHNYEAALRCAKQAIKLAANDAEACLLAAQVDCTPGAGQIGARYSTL